MKLFQVKQKLDRWITAAGAGAASTAKSINLDREEPSSDSINSPEVDAAPKTLRHGNTPPRASAQRGHTSKVIEWRRRVLIKKGARLSAAMRQRSDAGSLAMLDACGVVVYWCDRAPCESASDPEINVLKHHVSQFYVPEDVASSVPLLHLRSAVAGGTSTQSGWRKRSDGETIWATTVIEALSLRSGSLQGFSHIVRESTDPWIAENAGSARDLQQREAKAHRALDAEELGYTAKSGSRNET